MKSESSNGRMTESLRTELRHESCMLELFWLDKTRFYWPLHSRTNSFQVGETCSIPIPLSELDQSKDESDRPIRWLSQDYRLGQCWSVRTMMPSPDITVELVGLNWSDSDKAVRLLFWEKLVYVRTDWYMFWRERILSWTFTGKLRKLMGTVIRGGY